MKKLLPFLRCSLSSSSPFQLLQNHTNISAVRAMALENAELVRDEVTRSSITGVVMIKEGESVSLHFKKLVTIVLAEKFANIAMEKGNVRDIFLINDKNFFTSCQSRWHIP